MKRRTGIIALTIVLAFMTPSRACAANSSPPDLAFGAYQRGYYVTAMKEALKRLEDNAGDHVAMTLVARLFHDGTGVRQNLAEAARWYKLAAERGNREAMFGFAAMILLGEGISLDKAAAGSWLEKAAGMGHAGALYNLGVLEIEKPGKPDYWLASGLFEKAALLGDADAAYALASLYREGRGVAQNAAKSTQWLAASMALGHAPGLVEYAIALFNGTGIAKDENAAAKLFLKAAYANNSVAQNRLARVLAAGRGGLQKDLVEAMKWHLLARAAGIQDEWLDAQLKSLSAIEQTEVEIAVRAYVGN